MKEYISKEKSKAPEEKPEKKEPWYLVITPESPLLHITGALTLGAFMRRYGTQNVHDYSTRKDESEE